MTSQGPLNVFAPEPCAKSVQVGAKSAGAGHFVCESVPRAAGSLVREERPDER